MVVVLVDEGGVERRLIIALVLYMPAFRGVVNSLNILQKGGDREIYIRER